MSRCQLDTPLASDHGPARFVQTGVICHLTITATSGAALHAQLAELLPAIEGDDLELLYTEKPWLVGCDAHGAPVAPPSAVRRRQPFG